MQNNIRYQVFISSTYADLVDERRSVIETLLMMDCIPAGMELFPAMDEEQFAFIQKILADCDYYLLILGGRYGSMAPDGVSFTEKEYDYALSLGLKVVGLVHSDLDSIPAGKSEGDPELKNRLLRFREKVTKGRLVKMWRDPTELRGLVSLSLQQTIKMFPAVGWTRANQVTALETLTELNRLRNENDDLKRKLSDFEPPLPGVAGLEEHHTISGTLKRDYSVEKWSLETTWGRIFSTVGPQALSPSFESDVRSTLETALQQELKDFYRGFLREVKLFDADFDTIKIQFMALGLIEVVKSSSLTVYEGLFWSLTDRGRSELLRIRSVKVSS